MRHWRRYLSANVRDVRVLLREFRLTLALFACLVGLGTLAFCRLYVNPDTGNGLSPIEAFYAVFYLIFMQPMVPFPRPWHLQALFFVVPILGLGVLGEGIVRFGVLLLNKRARLEEWQVALASTYSNHVVVCGVGRLGYRVVEQLLECGEEVVAVEVDPDDQFLARVRERCVPVILGDARSTEILEQAGVRRALAIIPCTENDLANLEIALDARALKPEIKVVLRMFDSDLAGKVSRGFGIDTAFSTSALAAPAFAAAATQAGTVHALDVGGARLMVAQMSIPMGSSLAGKTVAEVQRRFDLSVILHQRKGPVDLHPAPETVLQDGDCIALLATRDVLKRVRKANSE